MITAIIPARGNSKGIPKKNIVNIGGFPLIAYSIAAAKLSKKIDRVVISTDSEEIADIAKQFGAEVPFIRPKKFSGDKSPDLDFIKHALSWFKKNEGKIPTYLVHLRPTTPLRHPSDIDKAIQKIKKNPKATSLRSAHELRESPFKLFRKENEYFAGLFPREKRSEYYNLPRQAFPTVYQPDGYVDILIPEHILKTGKLHGNKILSFISQNTGELDNAHDVEFINYKLKEEHWEIHAYLNRFKKINK